MYATAIAAATVRPEISPIFISYRRDDGGHARALYEKLREWFDETELFLDHENLDPGAKFRPVLDEAIHSCTIFLAVIGPQWLSDKNRQRLHDPEDITRGEIQAALTHGKTIIPVLSGGAGFPAKADLPEGIRGINEANAHHQLEAQYRATFQTLLDTLERQHDLKPRYRRRDGRRQPFHVAGMRQSTYFADPAAHLPALHRLLAENERAALTATTVQGMGGVGKTQLALRFSHAFRDEYDGVWWFRAEENASLQEDCIELCRELDIARADQEEPSRSVARWLKKQPRWLLVYDNVETSAAVAPHLPEAGEHHVIITSRNHELHDLAAAALDLAAWNEEEALDFLRPRLPEASDEERRALARSLAGLPLALEQAGAYLGKTRIAVADYLAALDDFAQRERLLAREDSALCPLSVQATLSLAFERLSEPARELLGLCAWLAPEPIPEFLFTEKPGLLPPALAAVASDALTWGETVAELAAYGLCHRSGEGQRLSFHRLTLAAAQVRERGQEDCLRIQGLLRAACLEDSKLPKHWPRYAAILPHVTHLDRYLAAGWLDRRWHAWLLDRIASYLHKGPALYTKSAQWFRRALELNLADLGEEHQYTLISMNNLAETFRAQGDLAGALDIHKSGLAICRHALGEEHPDTLTSLNNLALTLQALGELAGALEHHKSVLAIRRRVQGEEHPDTVTSMENLAGILYAQGDLDGARQLQKSALAVRHRVQGKEHPDTVTSINNFAVTLRAQGDLAGALELEKSALMIRCSLLGKEHPDTLMSMNNLAGTLYAHGDLDGALELHKSSLATRRHLLGEEHPDTLMSMNNLAVTFRAQGDLASALELQKSTLAIRRRVFGEEHPDTLMSINNLAHTLYDQGDLAGALELEKSVLAIRRRLLGDEHPDTLISISNLAETLSAQGNQADALELQKSALAIRCRVLGEEHPDTLTSMNNLAITLWGLGEQINAAVQMRAAADGRARALGPPHPDTINSEKAAKEMQQALNLPHPGA
jgi:hypothetical protein